MKSKELPYAIACKLVLEDIKNYVPLKNELYANFELHPSPHPSSTTHALYTHCYFVPPHLLQYCMWWSLFMYLLLCYFLYFYGSTNTYTFILFFVHINIWMYSIQLCIYLYVSWKDSQWYSFIPILQKNTCLFLCHLNYLFHNCMHFLYLYNSVLFLWNSPIPSRWQPFFPIQLDMSSNSWSGAKKAYI